MVLNKKCVMKFFKLNLANISSILLILLSLYIVLFNFFNFKTPIPNKEQSEDQTAFNQSAFIYANEIIYNFITESITIVDKNVRFINMGGSSYSLYDLLNGYSGRYFFYIPKISCHNCFHDFLEQIFNTWGSKKFNSIIFFTSFQNTEDIVEIQNTFNITIYTIGQNYIGFESERSQNYFMFYLDSDLNTSYYFPFYSEVSDYNLLYLRICKRDNLFLQ